ncbi:hypothetical protein AAFF27_15975 [Xylophilus sp. GW821-FHT01B05]
MRTTIRNKKKHGTAPLRGPTKRRRHGSALARVLDESRNLRGSHFRVLVVRAWPALAPHMAT